MTSLANRRRRRSGVAYRTTRRTQWHDDHRGFYTIEPGTACVPIKVAKPSEQKAIEKARDIGQRLILVTLKGERRMIRSDSLEAFIP